MFLFIPYVLSVVQYIECKTNCEEEIWEVSGLRKRISSYTLLETTFPNYFELALFKKSDDKIMFSFYSSNTMPMSNSHHNSTTQAQTLLEDEIITYELTIAELTYIITNYIKPNIQEWYKTEYEPYHQLTYNLALIALCLSLLFPVLYVFFKILKCFLDQKTLDQDDAYV